jgi:hypothetical protein
MREERYWIGEVYAQIPPDMHPCHLSVHGNQWSAKRQHLGKVRVHEAANDVPTIQG